MWTLETIMDLLGNALNVSDMSRENRPIGNTAPTATTVYIEFMHAPHP